ncbi:MAG: hypothetical protein KUG77_27875 [Nannocystaceae bacterium]|nr:hypothetical protein [Nannocystaceae bacterium]
MRAYVFGLALCVLPACGTGDDEKRNAPPVGGGSGPVGGGSSAPTTGSSDTDGGSGSGSDSGTGLTMGPPTASGGTSTGSGPYAVLTGRFTDGGGGYALPIQCTVRFHRPGERHLRSRRDVVLHPYGGAALRRTHLSLIHI